MANEMQKTTPFGMRDKVGYMFGDFANDFTFSFSLVTPLRTAIGRITEPTVRQLK